jgi:hypothetical protein
VSVADLTPIQVATRSKAWVRPLACWDGGFQSHRGHGCLSVVSDVCGQVEVSATNRALVQRSPTECVCVVCVCGGGGV